MRGGRSWMPALLALWCCSLCLRANSARAQLDDDDETSSETPAADESENPGSEPDASPTDGKAPRAVRLQLAGGLGMGTRGLQRPTLTGVQRLSDAAFVAAEVALRVRAWPEESFALEALIHYQTSIGWRVDGVPAFALPNPVETRAERAEVSLAPVFRLGDSAGALQLAFPIGVSVRTFWPTVHDTIAPGYSLIGPMLRAELTVPLGQLLRVRVGPELMWIVAIDKAIRVDGVASQGGALGGTLTLEAPITGHLALEFCYRESHAFAPNAASGRSFKDVERFATARLAGSL
jgi:hypothetical protein